MSRTNQELFGHGSCNGEDVMNLESNYFATQVKDNANVLKTYQSRDDKFEEIIMKKLSIYSNNSFLNVINDDESDLMKENEYMLNSHMNKAPSCLESEDLSVFGDSQDLFNDINLEVQGKSNFENVDDQQIESAEAEVPNPSPPAESIPVPDISEESKAKRYSKKDDIGK